jgi:hypothetical protein
MKTHKQKYQWLIDAGLFTAFLLSFWLELTGVALHQWLGVAIGAVAGYHLLTHWTWVKAVTDRFLKQTSTQARVYYVIDAAVLIGLAAIIVTGLVISTWLSLALTNYAAWKTIHVIASIGTLAAIVIKLGLHWRWIIATARRYIVPQPAPVPAANGIGRREFLRLMGGVSVVAAIAAISAVDALAQSAETTAVMQNSTSKSTQTASTQNCVVRCNRRCSYPGHCRRYTDSNNNGRCDLGECV